MIVLPFEAGLPDAADFLAALLDEHGLDVRRGLQLHRLVQHALRPVDDGNDIWDSSAKGLKIAKNKVCIVQLLPKQACLVFTEKFASGNALLVGCFVGS